MDYETWGKIYGDEPYVMNVVKSEISLGEKVDVDCMEVFILLGNGQFIHFTNSEWAALSLVSQKEKDEMFASESKGYKVTINGVPK